LIELIRTVGSEQTNLTCRKKAGCEQSNVVKWIPDPVLTKIPLLRNKHDNRFIVFFFPPHLSLPGYLCEVTYSPICVEVDMISVQ
jgi:hypothetical protein